MGLVTQQDPIGIAGGLNLYGYANGDPINFSDPFGLCDDPTDPVCSWFEASFAMLGSVAGFVGGGGVGAFATAASGGALAPAAVAATAQSTAAGAALGLAVGQMLSPFVFSKSHTVGQANISGHGTIRVDWNEPRGTRPGDVHVQGKDFYQRIDVLDDLQNLPRRIRNNADIQKWVEKGLKLLEEFSGGNQ